jgi:UDP-glucuronate 4-epimerase
MSVTRSTAGRTPVGPRRYLVTGALGCIGAWTVRALLEDGAHTVAFDLDHDDHRLSLAVPEEMRDAIVRVVGDITDRALLERTIEDQALRLSSTS